MRATWFWACSVGEVWWGEKSAGGCHAWCATISHKRQHAYAYLMAKRNTMNISLPPALKKWVEKRVDEEGFGTSSEFVRHVLRQAKLLHDAGDIDDQLEAALASGPITPLRAMDFERIKRNGRAIAKAMTRRRSS